MIHRLLGSILFPGTYLVLHLGGDGGGDSGAQSKADEDRKAALRSKIDSLYGIETPVTKYQLDNGTLLDKAPDPVAQFDANGNPVLEPNTIGDGGQDQVMAAPHYTTLTLPDTVAQGAQKQLSDEDKQVSDATRGYYSDQLARSFAAAERNNRFALARSGLEGGSQDVDSNAELNTDNNLGLTRIDQVARQSASALDTQREQERLNAVNLVNAGAGEDAVLSAQAGLKGALTNAQNQSRADIFSDLFSSAANANAASNQNAALAAMLSRYNGQLSSFFPVAGGGSAGRVTPSA